MQRCRDVGRQAIVSMMIMCNDIVMIKHGGRRSGLPNALVVMEHDTTEGQINRPLNV